MIIYSTDTVFNVGAQTIVNAVNCVGVMGKGLALEFKLRYPQMFTQYKEFCRDGKLTPARPKLHRGKTMNILSFATKMHWRDKSRYDYIEAGLSYFVANYKKANITSVAFPLLGCGLGGLDKDRVLQIMEKYLSDIDIPVYICLATDEAKGIEKAMIEAIKSDVTIKLDLGNIRHFWEISKQVDSATYQRLFTYYYNKVK